MTSSWTSRHLLSCLRSIYRPQHFLYFSGLPLASTEPHGQGSFLPTFSPPFGERASSLVSLRGVGLDRVGVVPVVHGLGRFVPPAIDRITGLGTSCLLSTKVARNTASALSCWKFSIISEKISNPSRLVLVQGIPLCVPAKPDPLLQVIHGVEVVHPLTVQGLEHPLADEALQASFLAEDAVQERGGWSCIRSTTCSISLSFLS